MQISTNHYQILVYNSEIWPENQLVYTKSNCIGFRITSSVAMIIGVTNGLQEACNWHGWGGVRCSQNLQTKAYVTRWFIALHML